MMLKAISELKYFSFYNYKMNKIIEPLKCLEDFSIFSPSVGHLEGSPSNYLFIVKGIIIGMLKLCLPL